MSAAEYDYWKESIEAALEDMGVDLDKRIIDGLAEAIKVSHDNYGIAFNCPDPFNTEQEELKVLKAELEAQKE